MTDETQAAKRPNPDLLHRIYVLATSMPPRISFEEMFKGSNDADLEVVITRLEGAISRFGGPYGHARLLKHSREDVPARPASPTLRDIEKVVAGFGSNDVANLSDRHLEENVERLAPGLLSGGEGSIRLMVRGLDVEGPAGDQRVHALGQLRLNDRIEVLNVVVTGTWNGKEVGFESMHLA